MKGPAEILSDRGNAPLSPSKRRKKRGARRKEAWAKVADPIKKPRAAFVSIGKIPDEAKLYVAMTLHPNCFRSPVSDNGSHLASVARRREEALSQAAKMIRALVRWETGAVSNMTHDAKLRLRKKIHRATRERRRSEIQ